MKTKKILLSTFVSVIILSLLIFSGYIVSSANHPNEPIPTELFDIKMNLEETTLENSCDLRAIIIYESFGRVPTHIDLDYSIYNESGEKIYTKLDKIVVEIEEAQRIDFKDLKLGPGKYKFVLETTYNIDVHDDFTQFFIVKRKGFFSMLLEFFSKLLESFRVEK